MAIDFLICVLLLISLAINLLALGAFWVTPGLRTTANRFVINLLIVNIFGCISLAPVLFINNPKLTINALLNDSETSTSTRTTIININNDDSIVIDHQYQSHKISRRIDEQFINSTLLTKVTCNNSRCETILVESDRDNDRIVIAELDSKEFNTNSNTNNINNNNIDNSPDDDDHDDNDKVHDDNGNLSDDLFDDYYYDTGSSSNSNSDNDQKFNNNNNINLNNFNKKHKNNINNKNNITPPNRSWTIDLAAALGALSVLLVVGDTWCAVTDPLRYHSRISGLKAWILIAITWILGIFFGILSALRENAFSSSTTSGGSDGRGRHHPQTVMDDESFDQNTASAGSGAAVSTSSHHPYLYSYQPQIVTIQPNELYNMIFSCFYFIVIILLPFGFVCGMYWRIFSEARENGLRMRQNGSSPLLQSALNLTGGNHHHHHNHHNHHNSHNTQQQQQTLQTIKEPVQSSDGLTMKIDRRRSSSNSEKDATKPLLMPPTPIHKISSKNKNADNDVDVEKQQEQQEQHIQPKPTHIIRQDRNQNILLTLSTDREDLKRNYSARQLFLLGSSQDLNDTNKKIGIRQVHSTPNLNKSPNGITNNCIDNSHHALQLPTVNVPPKALSYMTSIRHRLSNASSLFKYREESRAARISILVVIMFLISYLPYGLLVLLQGRLTNLFTNSTQVAIFMCLMANLSSPFIFAYRNKRVRRGVKRLFGLDAKYRDQKLYRSGGGLLRCGTKASINVRRSVSKASTYSVNSCKYLTPHPVANGTFLMEIEKCHYIKNDTTNKTFATTLNAKAVNCGALDAVQIFQDSSEKRSILKRVCDTSRKLGCATNSCANSDNEQTDV